MLLSTRWSCCPRGFWESWLVQEFGLLYVGDLNIGFLCRWASGRVMGRLQEPCRNFVVAGVGVGMLGLVP